MPDVLELEFLQRLRATFRLEAEEHLQALSATLIELEKPIEPERQAELLESCLREAHSLKGAARSVNLKDVESICQPLESLLVGLKRQSMLLTPALFDLLHETVDRLTHLVVTEQSDRTSADRSRGRELVRQLVKAGQTEASEAAALASQALRAPAESLGQPEPAPDQPDDPSSPIGLNATTAPAGPVATVRISIAKLDPLLLQAEEMIQAKLAAAERSASLRDIQQELFAWKAEAAKWKDQRAGQPAETPISVGTHLENLLVKVTEISRAFEQDQRALRHQVAVHVDTMKQLLMMPVATLLEGFPRLVRDLARDQGKDVDLTVSGAELEIDKRILEQLKDPLIHLVRNAIDHGLEMPAVRARLGKPARGALTLAISSSDGRQIEIVVSDDGAGVELGRVQAAAIKAGLLSGPAAEQLPASDALPLIFQSGLSTSPILTDISGRGLGLAIVREKVENLGGLVTVQTRSGLGTTFRLALPLTLATFRGVLVRARMQLFMLPTAQVERVVRVRRDDIRTIENRETIRLDGQVLALVRLADVLGLPARSEPIDLRPTGAETALAEHVPVLIVMQGEKRLAVQVEEVLAEEEVLVKGLGRQLRRVRNIAGATVLGAGTVVPVLNVSDLLISAVRPGGAIGAPLAAGRAAGPTGRILLADDSITARTLLKNILETGGYQVTTVVDGAEAFSRLNPGEFDLVVSDVDMPRMSGFELTTKIRADPKLSELPVVLVTALDARQDRERGVEVGANAYIIKSSFDQGNLLEVIHRLL